MITILNRLVDALHPRLHDALGVKELLLALIAHLPGLLLAILGVAVLLGLLRASLHFQLTNLLWLEMAVLLLYWEVEDVGELLTIPVNISLAHFHLDLSWDVVTILLWFPFAFNPLRSIAVVLGTLHLVTCELHGVGAGHIVDHLLFHVAVWCFHIGALVVVLGGSIDLVGGVTHPVLPSEAPLHLVSLLQCLVVDGLHQVAHQLVHIKADSLHISFDNSSTVLVFNWKTCFCILCPACRLSVILPMVLEHDLLHLMAVGVLVDTISPNISLPYVRVVPLGRPWRRILRWRGCTKCKGKNKK